MEKKFKIIINGVVVCFCFFVFFLMLSEESKFTRTLFEASKVAGSATHKQSMTLCGPLRFVCLCSNKTKRVPIIYFFYV